MMFYFIGREDKLNDDNRVLVNNFQVELAQQIGYLCNLVASSVSQQNEHLQSVEKLCCSFTDRHDKVLNGFGIQDSPLDLTSCVTVLLCGSSCFVVHLLAVADLVFINFAFRQSWM